MSYELKEKKNKKKLLNKKCFAQLLFPTFYFLWLTLIKQKFTDKLKLIKIKKKKNWNQIWLQGKQNVYILIKSKLQIALSARFEMLPAK